MKTLLLPLLAAAALLPPVAAHADGASTYQPRKTFAPFQFRHAVNRYRSADGSPGPDYWQNRADYTIKAKLDPKTKTLSASETITYTNHSPHTLHQLWLQMDQNRYRQDARSNFSGGKMPAAKHHTRGYQLTAVKIQSGGHSYKAHYVISDTRMRVDLKQPLPAHKGTLKLQISYHYTVPGPKTGGRTDWVPSRNGDIFDIAQWYPRMCVYDDLRGWDTAPFLNNEFYTEYGNFDYSVTVPWNMLVAGSGQLQNPRQVLTATERQRLDKARHSDKTVMIRSASEIGDASTRPVQHGDLTWHFRMQHARDVSFVASTSYIWDAARVDLPHGRHALAMSLYPVESAGKKAWGRSTQYLKHAMQIFSRQWYPYPYPVAVAAGGGVGGMEYPGIVFDSSRDGGKSLFALTAHEIGHTWFPMIVGSDERRNAWMDEGFNTFIDVYASQQFNHGEYAPKRDGEFAPEGGNPVKDILEVLDDPHAPPIMTRADVIPEKYRHPVTYFKTALGLKLLREQILGPQRFDPAFRQYIAEWAYRHPSPSDFFRAMDSAGGEDLSWFWREWFRHNWKLDMAVTKVEPVKGDYAHGAMVTVANLDRMIMPATLQVTYADGSTSRVRVPVATWMQHHHFAVNVPGNKAVVSASIDPDHVIPDDHRGNNVYKVAH